jgi:hypothetical protein
MCASADRGFESAEATEKDKRRQAAARKERNERRDELELLERSTTLCYVF